MRKYHIEYTPQNDIYFDDNGVAVVYEKGAYTLYRTTGTGTGESAPVRWVYEWELSRLKEEMETLQEQSEEESRSKTKTDTIEAVKQLLKELMKDYKEPDADYKDLIFDYIFKIADIIADYSDNIEE